jgi:hypothetical protein
MRRRGVVDCTARACAARWFSRALARKRYPAFRRQGARVPAVAIRGGALPRQPRNGRACRNGSRLAAPLGPSDAAANLIATTVQLPEASHMKTLARFALTIGLAATLLVGCGGSQPPIGVPLAAQQGRAIAAHAAHGASWMSPQERVGSPDYEVSGPLLYVANYGYDSVTVYHVKRRNPTPIATILDGLNSPTGDCLDSQGTLYVTNEPISNGGWVSKYPLGKTEPSMTITNGINTAAYCAIDSAGNLWVTNIGGPNVTEYLRGSNTPHIVITKGLAYPVGIAIDHSGNLYVSDRKNSDVVVYAARSKTPSRTITDRVTSPVGMAIDANGVLYVANITEKNVEEYLPGAAHPYKTITQGMPTPAGVIASKNGWLYVANGSGVNDLVVEFPPGSVTPSKRHVSKDLHGPLGVAVFPPVLP